MNASGARKPIGESHTLWANWLIVLPVLACVLGCVLRSPRKFLWFDEALTAKLMDAPSLGALFHALGDQADGNPPLYFGLLWLWTRVAGLSELALRIPSALCFGVAILVLYRTLKQFLPPLVAVWGAAVPFMLSNAVWSQIAEARCYGLLVLLYTLSLSVYIRLVRESRPSISLLFGVVTVHAALSLTHVYGIVYSCAMFAALLGMWLFQRRIRVSAFVAVLGGVACFGFWLPSYLRQVEMTRPRFWLGTPSWADLMQSLDAGIQLPLCLFALGATLFAASIKRAKAQTVSTPSDSAEANQNVAAALFFAAASLAVIPTVWAFSRAVKPIFTERYVIPSVIGWAVLLTLVAARVVREGATESSTGSRLQLHPWGKAVIAFTIVAAAAAFVLKSAMYPVQREIGFTETFFPNNGLPVILEDGTTYLQMRRYAADPSRFKLVVDWPSALEGSSTTSTLNYKIMSAIARNFPEEEIYESGALVPNLSQFLVLDSEDVQWFERLIANSPDFRWTEICRLNGARLLDVSRR